MGREVAPSSTCHTSLSLRSCVFVASMVSFEILDFRFLFFVRWGPSTSVFFRHLLPVQACSTLRKRQGRSTTLDSVLWAFFW